MKVPGLGHRVTRNQGQTSFLLNNKAARPQAKTAEKQDLGVKTPQLEIPCLAYATKLRLFSQSSQFYKKRLP